MEKYVETWMQTLFMKPKEYVDKYVPQPPADTQGPEPATQSRMTAP